jgi:hypothetical protein
MDRILPSSRSEVVVRQSNDPEVPLFLARMGHYHWVRIMTETDRTTLDHT